jgi:hypothetical protein
VGGPDTQGCFSTGTQGTGLERVDEQVAELADERLEGWKQPGRKKFKKISKKKVKNYNF